MEWFKNKEKTIKIEDLKKHYKIDNNFELKPIIDNLIDNKILKERNKKKVTLEQPCLCESYTNLMYVSNDKKIEKYNSFFKEKSMNFCNIDISYYHNNVKDFMNDYETLISIEKYFKSKNPNNNTLEPRNKRSFEIFRNEKKMGESNFKTICKRLKLTFADFNISNVLDYTFSSKTLSKNILIVENKENYFNYSRLIKKGKTIANEEFKAIIFGSGWRISESIELLETDDYQELDVDKSNFYYFGDLDAAGLNILAKILKKTNGEVKPWIGGYEYLINYFITNPTSNFRVKENEDHNITYETVEFCFSKFSVEKIDLIYNFCKDNNLVPQEMLSR